MYKLISYHSNILIPFGGSLSLKSNHSYLYIIQLSQAIKMLNSNQVFILEHGNFIVSGDILLENYSQEMVTLCLMCFSSTATTRVSIICEHILSDLILREIKKGVYNHSDVVQIELLFNEYINNVNQQQRQSMPLITKKIDSRLIMVNRYIRKYYSDPITLDKLADLIGCNPVYLSNTYSKVFKISPIKHLQVIRMKKACDLLTETNLVISEIASKLGYYSVSQFGVFFKRQFGHTPKEYRKRVN